MEGIILRPMPMGALAFVSVSFAMLSGTLAIGEGIAAFGSTVVWLVVAALFIATAFVKDRIRHAHRVPLDAPAGKTRLGLAYGFVVTDLIVAPAIPSIRGSAGRLTPRAPRSGVRGSGEG